MFRIAVLVTLFVAAFGNLLGGWTDVDVSDKHVIEAVQFATKSLSNVFKSKYHTKMVHLVKAEKQVVAGMRYKLNMELGITNCKKSEVAFEEADKCDLQEGLTNRMCEAHIYDQPWLNTKKMVHFSCILKRESSQKKDNSLTEDEMFVAQTMFDDFIVLHNKKYNSLEEKERRFGIFQENLKKIKQLNENEQGTARYGVTKFTDLTEEEYKKYLGFRPDLQGETLADAEIPTDPIPTSFDWRSQGVVSEVKNQGQCGSCWAFSTTGNIEGQWAIKKKKLVSLSEQELVDCDKVDEGCNGGLPSNAYKEIIRIGGLETEKEYPYEGEDDKCKYNTTETKVYINSSVALSKNETEMAAWLVKNGPISIGINANAMQFYFGGISHPWKILCSPSNLDHGVLIVGFGVHKYPLFSKTIPYWIIKNSWGSGWGEQGYYRVYRGDGTCGLNQMATSAVIN